MLVLSLVIVTRQTMLHFGTVSFHMFKVPGIARQVRTLVTSKTIGISIVAVIVGQTWISIHPAPIVRSLIRVTGITAGRRGRMTKSHITSPVSRTAMASGTVTTTNSKVSRRKGVVVLAIGMTTVTRRRSGIVIKSHIGSPISSATVAGHTVPGANSKMGGWKGIVILAISMTTITRSRCGIVIISRTTPVVKS